MAEMIVSIDSSVPVNVTGSVAATITPSSSITPITTLTAATTGTGTTIDFGRAQRDLSMAIIVTGTVTAGMVAFDVSQDGTNFVQFSVTSLTTNTNAKLTSSSEAWRYARGRIAATVTGGATVTCTLMTGS